MAGGCVSCGGKGPKLAVPSASQPTVEWIVKDGDDVTFASMNRAEAVLWQRQQGGMVRAREIDPEESTG